jgi:hypothetical protein
MKNDTQLYIDSIEKIKQILVSSPVGVEQGTQTVI